jgi:hypothetical protein
MSTNTIESPEIKEAQATAATRNSAPSGVHGFNGAEVHVESGQG